MAENMKNLDSSCHSIAQPCYDKLLPDLEAQIQVKLSGLKSKVILYRIISNIIALAKKLNCVSQRLH